MPLLAKTSIVSARTLEACGVPTVVCCRRTEWPSVVEREVHGWASSVLRSRLPASCVDETAQHWRITPDKAATTGQTPPRDRTLG